MDRVQDSFLPPSVHESSQDNAIESRRNYELPDLEFNEARSVNDVPTPDEVPERNFRADLPLEIKRSATVEALISQNDDMIARLKVNLRRLSLTENENDRLRRIHATLEAQNIALRDELEMSKEKQILLAKKERQLFEALEEFKVKFPEYQSLGEKLERYKKYHERIKTQVKPFIHQLKGYADSLTLEIRRLSQELSSREGEIDSLRRTRLEIEAGLDQMRQDAEERQCLLVTQYERQIESARTEVKELLAKNSRLEMRAQAFDEVRVRESELENLIIAMRRQKDDFHKETLEREQDIRAELGQTRSQLADSSERLQDKIQRETYLKGENERLTSQNLNLSEQLASLRVLWGNKSRETEELNAKLSALERLNLELSQALASQRQQG